jgi:hypothetical protein
MQNHLSHRLRETGRAFSVAIKSLSGLGVGTGVTGSGVEVDRYGSFFVERTGFGLLPDRIVRVYVDTDLATDFRVTGYCFVGFMGVFTLKPWFDSSSGLRKFLYD